MVKAMPSVVLSVQIESLPFLNCQLLEYLQVFTIVLCIAQTNKRGLCRFGAVVFRTNEHILYMHLLVNVTRQVNPRMFIIQQYM